MTRVSQAVTLLGYGFRSGWEGIPTDTGTFEEHAEEAATSKNKRRGISQDQLVRLRTA